MLTKHIDKLIIIGFSLALAACGGGGGGGGGSTSPPSTRPTGDITFPFDSTQGTPSTYNGALSSLKDNYIAFFRDSLTLITETNLNNLTAAEFGDTLDEMPIQAIVDTNAQTAWQQGWTGKGVKVGHLDDFETDNQPFFAQFPIFKSHGDFTRFITLLIAPEIDHSSRQLTFGCNLDDSLQERQISAGYAHFEAQGYHIVNNSFGSDRYNNDICSDIPVPQLAPIGAWNDMITTYSQDEAFLSYANPSGETGTYNRNMLFVFAAGNDAENCFEGTSGCNLYAASIKKLRDDGKTAAGDRVIFVGSLEDNSTQLADYSHGAGEEMKNDFLVAHDDTLGLGDGAGTSLAAPRVTGAAALLRHKFPNLDGAALKQVLLQTADDLGDPGPDEVYGYGELNVLNSLSPIGRVTVD